MSEPVGRYEILEQIGQGGFALVYRARDTQLDRLVALKELRPALLNDPAGIRRFKREARTIARLDHPRIVTLFDVVEVADRLFLAMRLVDGPSLERRLAEQGRLAWDQALEILRAVAEGLDYAHGQGILHRDLKPANILLDGIRGPLLSDFGLAKMVGAASTGGTAAGSIVGTPHYIAPEVWEGEGATPQSDIYALGCILAEMLTGDKLFAGEAPPTVMMAHFSRPAIPERWPAGVPVGLTEVLRTALAQQPGARPATAGELVEALSRLTATESGPDLVRPGLALSLLGPPRTELDGVPLDVDRRKAIALLVYLALTPQPHQRDALATLFWPDYDQRSARGNLRRTLSVLKQALGAGWLEIDRESVSFRRQPQLWIDVEAFRQLLATGESHDHPRDEACPDCLPALSEAVALYRADFMTGFSLTDSPAFDDWQLFQAESLRRELVEALAKLGRGYARQGQFQAAIEFAHRWLALDPLHEPAQRQLMEFHARSGDRAAALQQYDECVRLFDEELGLPPDAETTALYEQIRAGQVGQRSSGAGAISPLPSSPAAPRPRHNLPAQTTPFIGRETELSELARLLGDPAIRLVTILGPGGMGKTRLALEAASAQLDRFSHGVYFVALAPLESPDPMVATIAEAVDFSFYEGPSPQQQLLDYLREKSLLLVLDNFEHLLAGVDLVSAILQAAAVKILVTSRERLKLSGETVFTLEGLDVPEAEPTPASGAVQLFLQTARQVRPDFELTEAELRSVHHICQLVQGMPLGLILAATWLELLSPPEIAAEIRQSLDFLESELRDLPARQRSMRAVFDHSWRLLSEPEREVFQQLTVFRGSFTREGAEVVTGASLRLLMSLVNKSLLQRVPAGRYEVHELLRQYGLDKLVEEPAQEFATRQRHSAYYCAFLHQREADLKGASQQTALAEIEADLENVRLAWTWAIEQDQYEAIDQALDSLYEFYQIRSRFQDGYDDFGQAVARLQAKTQSSSEAGDRMSEIVLTKLLARQSAFGYALGRYEAAGDLIQQCLVMARRLDLPREQALCLNVLGDMGLVQGTTYWEAEQRYQESLALSQASGDQLAQAASFEKWGFVNTLQGNYDQAYQLLQQSLHLYQEVEHLFGMAILLNEVAFAAYLMGKYPEAEQFWTESLALTKELGSRLGIAKALGGLGLVAWGLGGASLTKAKQLLQERLAIIRELGYPDELAFNFCILAHIHNDLGEYQAARKQALEALTISKRIGHTWLETLSLSILTETVAALKDFQAAWNHFYEALELAVNSRAHPPILIALANLAFLLAKDTEGLKQEVVSDEETASMKRTERAIEMLTLVMNHPATWQVYKDKAARLRTEIAAQLPAEVVAAAQARGKSKKLAELVAELLTEKDDHLT